MPDKNPTPLQASFWLTKQEKHYVLIICALALLGIAVRFFYLKYEKQKVYTPAGIGKAEGQKNQTGHFAHSHREDE